MTLIIAAEGKNLVIAGADGKSTYGEGTKVCVRSTKWYKISEHVIILNAGDGDLSHTIITTFKENLDVSEDGVTHITKKFIKFCREWFEHTKNFHFEKNTFPDCVFIIAGLDKNNGEYNKPKTYVTMSFDNFMLRSDDLGYKIEGIPMLARYLFKKYYEKAKSSIDELSSIIAGTLNDLIHVAEDGDVGEPISIIKIDKTGVIEFKENEVEGFINLWDSYTNWKILIK